MSQWSAERLGPAVGKAPAPQDWDGRMPSDDTFVQDSHGWARLLARSHDVIHRPFVTWILRFHLVDTLIKHPNTRQFGKEVMEIRNITSGPLYDWWNLIVLTANGERHTRLRAPLQRTFSFPLIAKLRPRVRALAEDLVDEMAGGGDVDFIDRFASQLPVRTICEVLGVPQADIPVFKRWADTLGYAFSELPEELRPEVDDAVRNLSAYAHGLVVERRGAPRDDFLSQLISIIDETGAYSEEELSAQILGLIFAGSDTTRTALSVAVTLLLQYRDQWELLVNQRDLLKNAVDESLRYEPTVASLPRITNTAMTIAQVEIPENSIIVMNMAAAQRDPARYADPDQFTITRTDLARGSIGFGGGPHRCLGEALARTELEEALDVMAERVPHMQLSGGLPNFEALATGIRRLENVTIRL